MEIKPITIKPVVPAATPAAAPDAPAADAPAPAVPPSGIKPISIKPMVVPSASAVENAGSSTIRLKPVASDGGAPAASAPLKPAPLKPMPLKPTPLSAPPAGPAAAPVPMQALKGKTSRISLDSALSSPPTAAAAPAMGKLTSNLSAAAQAAKGQTAKVSLTIMEDDAMTRHQTLRMKAPTAKPAAPSPAAPKPAADDASEAPTFRKKTLVPKKDGEGSGSAPAPASGGEDTKPTLRLKPQEGGPTAATKPKITLKGKTAAEKDEEKKKADEAEEKAAEAAPSGAPGSGFDPSMVVQKPEKTNPVFPIFAIASILVAMFTIILFMSERSSTGGADLSYTKLVFRYGPNSEHAGEPLGFPVFAGKQWQCPGLPRVTLHR